MDSPEPCHLVQSPKSRNGLDGCEDDLSLLSLTSRDRVMTVRVWPRVEIADICNASRLTPTFPPLTVRLRGAGSCRTFSWAKGAGKDSGPLKSSAIAAIRCKLWVRQKQSLILPRALITNPIDIGSAR